ncbi:thiolase family protein [Halalkalicoccus sp. NIPERK01]|uniref:thiolase family protein n=1 Tax=Halalkalicoccus sp. NIPERK01 TaxID=3053469 RepID=UPI00256F0435|nr:thiolase family protein [Halalkalicoccus sp. NIPERK01]MDL5362308.1 thiolase family protein [Halalkalicoccus sp. NIPERK01]
MVYLVDAVRTPHGALLGGLSEVGAVELGAAALDGLRARTDLDPAGIDWVGLGEAIQAGVGQVPARQAVLEAGFDAGTEATTVNEASGSGLRAIALAVDRIESGRASVAVAGGMESMSNAPHVSREHRRGKRLGDSRLVDTLVYDALWDVTRDAHMGELTEALAERFDVSREAQDAYAAESNRRAAAAIDGGRFDAELVAVEGVTEDEGPRPDSTVESLGELPPAFAEDGTITAGNASSLSDGAGCALLVGDGVEGFDDPLAEVVDYALAYRDPEWFGIAVGNAVEALLDRNGLAVDDVDSYELNEAFAAQMVHVRERLGIPPEIQNPDGGAVALGHPIGASGGILTTTLAHRMDREDHTRGVVGMSIGGGGGIAMLLER